MRELKLFDEQKIKKMKKAAAVGAVFVTLGCGVAEAMPSGGTVVTGSVTVDAGTGVGSGNYSKDGNITIKRPDEVYAPNYWEASIAVSSGPAIINWESFDLGGSGPYDTLNIDTTKGALLNRVAGVAGISGHLVQTGSNPCWIVSPTGISVGERGEVTASNLVLSVIDISDKDFIDIASVGKSCSVVGEPRRIEIEEGEYVLPSVMWGERHVPGAIQIAEGVIVEMPGSEYKFTDTGIPTPVQAALEFVSGEADKLTDITNVNKVLEGNAMPAASEPAKDSAAVEAVIEEPMGGIGQITGNSFILGADTSAEDENVSYVAVGDVGNLVAINVWNNDGTSPSEAGANDGTAAGNANGGVDTNGRRSRLQ